MTPLYLMDIAEAAGGRLVGKNRLVSDITTDSRKIGKDALFVAVKGDNFDGHDFIEKALANGAVSFIGHRRDYPFCSRLSEGGKLSGYILVEDTRKALLDIAAYYRGLFDIPAVAVTGSAGKTTVKNGIASVLSQKYNVLKTEGNFNNEIGLPLTVFKLDNSYETAVFEMGMNSFGEISNLSRVIKPAAAVITNVGTAHIEGLGSREGILKAKLEIMDGMDESGTLILNYDNDMLKTLKGEANLGRIKQKIVWFSTVENADIYSEWVGESDLIIHYGQRTLRLLMETVPRQLVSNVLAEAAAGFIMGLTDSEIKRGIENIAAEKGRLWVYQCNNGLMIIDDSYNANADSMRLAIDFLKSCDLKGEGKEKIAVLGDMFELGDFAEQLHEEVGAYTAVSGINTLVAIGKHAEYYKKAFDLNKDKNQKSLYFKSKAEFLGSGITFSHHQAVLVKASRGMGLDEVVEYLKNAE